MNEISANEELRLKLIEAEAVLKEAEEEYELFIKQLEIYKNVIKEQKEKIWMIKSRMSQNIQ